MARPQAGKLEPDAGPRLRPAQPLLLFFMRSKRILLGLTGKDPAQVLERWPFPLPLPTQLRHELFPVHLGFKGFLGAKSKFLDARPADQALALSIFEVFGGQAYRLKVRSAAQPDLGSMAVETDDDFVG